MEIRGPTRQCTVLLFKTSGLLLLLHCTSFLFGTCLEAVWEESVLMSHFCVTSCLALISLPTAVNIDWKRLSRLALPPLWS